MMCFAWIFDLLKKIIVDSVDGVDDDISTIFLGKTDGIYKKSSSSSQLILSYNCCEGYPRISTIDVKSAKVRSANGLKPFKGAKFISCYDGLTLLTSLLPSHQHILFNPLSNKIEARISPNLWGGSPCGFFFHPLANEYRILNVQKIDGNDKLFEYHIYLFGAKTWRRTFNPYFNCQPLYKTFRGEEGNIKPIVSNGALHWPFVAGKVMIFDIISEEFCFKPFPGGCYTKEEGFDVIEVLASEDGLCCFYVSCKQAVIDIWMLEDYANWCWSRKYSVNLDWDMIKYPLEAGYTVYSGILTDVTVLSIHKDELILSWQHRGVFSYNLCSNTVEKIHLKKLEMEEHLACYNVTCGLLPYTTSH